MNTNINKSILLNADSYKASMYVQYPPKTQYIYSYVESRGSKVADYTIFFGLQMFLKEYLSKPITTEEINIAEQLITAHGEPFNRKGWEYVVEKHGGKLPIVIRAVEEGTKVNNHNVLLTVENTDLECFWLTTYVETALLRAIWYPTTVATISHVAKSIIKKYLEETSDDVSGLLFKCHDFGSRGVSSFESAGIGGLAHLVNFRGSDTMTSLLYAREYYNHTNEPAGWTIRASEHSTIVSWGKEHEVDAYENMIDQFGDQTIFACVSDGFDIYNAVENLWGGVLKSKVQDMAAMLVIRPDSGIPEKVVVECMEILDRKFGSVVNSKGYKLLNKVRIIQGDGITIESIPVILEAVKQAGFSTDNLAMGMGGGLLQHCNRDTFKFAMKCSSAIIDGRDVDVYKDPITDKGKTSKKGRFALVKKDDNFETVNVSRCDYEPRDCLKEVYRNGEIVTNISLEEIRSNSEK